MAEFPQNADQLDDQQVIALLLKVRGSEQSKTSCGRRLLAWLRDLKE
jgi:hypothetical protein